MEQLYNNGTIIYKKKLKFKYIEQPICKFIVH